MVFSKNIVKVGKAEILNGIADRNRILTLYFSKDGDKVYKKTISLDGDVSVVAENTPISASEVLPLKSDFALLRDGADFDIASN